jgi:hypothetical protein
MYSYLIKRSIHRYNRKVIYTMVVVQGPPYSKRATVFDMYFTTDIVGSWWTNQSQTIR